MIKKITMYAFISALSFSSTLHAENACCISSFLSLEGSYTRNAVDNFDFIVLGTPDTLFSEKKNQPWGARIAGGVMRQIYDEFGVSAEIGWGFYGRTRLNAQGTGIFATIPATFSATSTITGFDLLLGASFLQPCYSIFLKGGALVETLHSRLDGTFHPSVFITDTFRFSNTRSGVLPEIKVGGSYIFNDNWSLTVAYMHAFGSNVKTFGSFDPTTFSSTLDIRFQEPSLNSVLFGIQWTF